jgi:hypothetical protein
MSEKVVSDIFGTKLVSVMKGDIQRDGIMYCEDRVSDLQKIFVCRQRVRVREYRV